MSFALFQDFVAALAARLKREAGDFGWCQTDTPDIPAQPPLL